MYLAIGSLFSQNISGIVEYEITYWECKYCHFTGKEKKLKNILKISDYKYLPSLYLNALDDEAEYGSIKSSYCALSNNVNNWHSNVEVDLPTTEKKSFENISKDRIIPEWFTSGRLEKVSYKINADFIKWKKIYDDEQEKKSLAIKKQEQKDKELFDSEFDKLEKLISNKEFEQAALLYTELSKGKFSYNEVLKSKKDFIQSGLNNSTTKTAILNSEELNGIILSNREYFKELIKDKPETIEIIFDQKGNGFINNSPSKIRNSKPFVLKEVGNFKVYCNSKGTFQLSTEQVQNPNKMYMDVWVAPNQKISKKGNKYFKKTSLSASVFKDEVSVINNNQVPYGKYWMVKHELKLSKVNGIEINREELLIKDSEKNLSRRLGMKIARGTSSLAILTWLTLRFIEFSSVK